MTTDTDTVFQEISDRAWVIFTLSFRKKKTTTKGYRRERKLRKSTCEDTMKIN